MPLRPPERMSAGIRKTEHLHHQIRHLSSGISGESFSLSIPPSVHWHIGSCSSTQSLQPVSFLLVPTLSPTRYPWFVFLLDYTCPLWNLSPIHSLFDCKQIFHFKHHLKSCQGLLLKYSLPAVVSSNGSQRWQLQGLEACFAQGKRDFTEIF